MHVQDGAPLAGDVRLCSARHDRIFGGAMVHPPAGSRCSLLSHFSFGLRERAWKGRRHCNVGGGGIGEAASRSG